MKNKKERKVEKITLSEKQREFLYCTFFVVVLLFLAFGDRIALHFIAKQPNPNNAISRGDSPVSGVPFSLEELDMTAILEKINNKETFLLVSTREKCYTCKSYIPMLEQEFLKYNITAYYINRSLYDMNQEEFVRFTEVHENLQKNLQYTPYVMYFKEGMLQDELIGSKEQIEIESFLKKNELENNKI